MNTLAEVLVVAMLAVGCFFTVLGAFALIKLPTFFQRIHGPTKASTLGVGGILITSILYHAMVGNSFHPRELLITLFLFMTAPISAYMMARAAFSLMQREGTAAPRPPPPDNASTDAVPGLQAREDTQTPDD